MEVVFNWIEPVHLLVKADAKVMVSRSVLVDVPVDAVGAKIAELEVALSASTASFALASFDGVKAKERTIQSIAKSAKPIFCGFIFSV